MISFYELLKNIDDGQFKKIAILAGHYCLSPQLEELSNEGDSEVFSFEIGLKAYLHLKSIKINCVLILWVNDIGIDNERRKAIKERYEIPYNYQMILNQHQVQEAELKVMFESSARNKASVQFRKIYKKTPQKFQVYSGKNESLTRCVVTSQCEITESKAYTVRGPDDNPLVLKEGSNPKCNLILATLFNTIEKHYQVELILNLFNNIYINRIRLGIYVGRNVYSLQTDFINVFCDDEEMFIENINFLREPNK